jgi:rifampicin phosphotransferase
MQDRWITDRLVGKQFPMFTRGNAGEVLPDPVSPLSWTFVWEPGIMRGCRDGFIEFRGGRLG